MLVIFAMALLLSMPKPNRVDAFFPPSDHFSPQQLRLRFFSNAPNV
jgi:hypothetical protein